MNEEKKIIEATGRLKHYLAQHHLRHTQEREMMLAGIVSLNKSFTPASLRSSLIVDGVNLSQATIYNSLKLFEQAGLIRKRMNDEIGIVYESVESTPKHILLSCSRCGKKKEVRNHELSELIGHHRFPSFAAEGFELVITGLCSKCRSGGRKKKKREKDK